MTIGQTLNYAQEKFHKKNIKNPHLEAEILLSGILGKRREYLLTHPKEKLRLFQIANYKLQVYKRTKGTPLSYLTKSQEFYGYDFFVNKHVLIPRPETEMMVDEIIKKEKRKKKKSILIDIGTGSGCIPISTIKALKERGQTGFQKVIASDVSKKALQVAKKNACVHELEEKIEFVESDLCDFLLNQEAPSASRCLLSSCLVITANLPYLTPAQIEDSPTIQKEPRLALESGPRGLNHYKQLLEQISRLIQTTNHKLQITAFLEIDLTQHENISKLITKILPTASFQIKKDLRGLSRLVIINC